MPVVGVASKLRQPSTMGTKPVHTALPIPSAVRAAASQGYMARQQELRMGQPSPRLSCQLSIKSEYQQEKTPEAKSRAETEESRICKVSGRRVCLGRLGDDLQVSCALLPQLGLSRCLCCSEFEHTGMSHDTAHAG